MIEIIKAIFLNSLITMALLFGSVIAAGLLLGALNRVAGRYMQLSVGWWGILVTAWIGTPIHELGHAFMCLVFGHKITEMKLFQNSEDGKLGYVRHSYNTSNIYQKIGNFFIGIAPILSGTGVILLLMLLLVRPIMGDLWNLASVGEPWKLASWPNFWTYLHEPRFWIFIALSVCVAAHMALSFSDLKGAFSGIITIFIIILAVNIILMVFRFDITTLYATAKIYNTYIIFGLLVAVFCSLCYTAISLILHSLNSSSN